MAFLFYLSLLCTVVFASPFTEKAWAHDELNLIEDFNRSLQNIFPEVDQTAFVKEPFSKDFVYGICADTRLRARVLKIDEESVIVKDNELYHRLPQGGGVCRQRVFDEGAKFLVETICIREERILMDFDTRFRKF